MYFLKITEEWPHEPADSMGLQVDTFLLDCCLVLQSQIYEEGIISYPEAGDCLGVGSLGREVKWQGQHSN
jgi:hypothetical protein